MVRVRELSIPEEFTRGVNYLEDPATRERFQAWVREIWSEKDALIERILKEYAQRTGGTP